jgi:hypothetical protein
LDDDQIDFPTPVEVEAKKEEEQPEEEEKKEGQEAQETPKAEESKTSNTVHIETVAVQAPA